MNILVQWTRYIYYAEQLKRHQPLVQALARSEYFVVCVMCTLSHTRVFY